MIGGRGRGRGRDRGRWNNRDSRRSNQYQNPSHPYNNNGYGGRGGGCGRGGRGRGPGSNLDGRMAATYENVCGNKGYSYDAYQFRRVPGRSMGVVITKVTETVCTLTVTRTVYARKHVHYPNVTQILAPCRADNHP
jgi:hypothetical protein